MPDNNITLLPTKPKEWWEPEIGIRPSGEVPQWAHGMVMMMLFIQFVVGSSSNIGVLMLFFKRKDFASPTNTIVQSLAVADLLMSSVGTFTPFIASYNQKWPFGELGCAYDGFLHYTVGIVQINTVVIVAVDRYICITRPMSPLKLNQAKAKMCVGIAWGFAIVIAFFPFLGWNKYVPEGPMTTCGIDWFSRESGDRSYIIFIFLANFIIPLCIAAFCYYFVYATIRNVSRNGVWDVNSEKGKKNLAAEKKMLKTCIALLGAFVVAWTPYALVAFVNAFGDPNSVPMFFQCFTPIFAKTQATLDPILYVGTNKRFREAFFEMLPCQCMADEDDDDDEPKKGGGNKVSPESATQVTDQTTAAA